MALGFDFANMRVAQAERLEALLRRIDIRGFPMVIGLQVVHGSSPLGPAVGIAIAIHTRNVLDGRAIVLDHITDPIGDSETDEQIATKIFKTALELLEHEMKEQFKLDGRQIFDPHPIRSLTVSATVVVD